MARRWIGQEQLSVGGLERRGATSLDEVAGLVDWAELDRLLADISASTKGEPGWPPLALFRALLLATWHDLSDVRLAEALDDRASFRRFCGFAAHEPTPERTAFVRFRAELVRRGLDRGSPSGSERLAGACAKSSSWLWLASCSSRCGDSLLTASSRKAQPPS